MLVPSRVLRTCAPTVVAVLAVSGCSFQASVGTFEVDSARLTSTVQDRLADTLGEVPDRVSCPKDLPGEVGATTRCVVTARGIEYGVTVTATAVKGKDVSFSVEADKTPVGGN